MFSTEMVVLMAIAAPGDSHSKVLTRVDVTGEYIGDLCDLLVRRGYLEENGSRGYQCTAKGRNAILWEAILLVTCSDEARAKGRMERLEWVYGEISQQLDSLEEELVKIFC